MTESQTCPCGSGADYAVCCEPRHSGEKPAETAEALLRSRYSAFVVGEVDYIVGSVHPEVRDELDRDNLESWSKNSTWKGLEILGAHLGGPEDDEGLVEFVARYEDAEGDLIDHHERSVFKKEDDRWYFLDGEPLSQEPYRREEPKVGRNEPCPCGSGKKFKKCHGRAA